jgi:hypothetical protein
MAENLTPYEQGFLSAIGVTRKNNPNNPGVLAFDALPYFPRANGANTYEAGWDSACVFIRAHVESARAEQPACA